MEPTKTEKARAVWKKLSPWLVGVSLLGAAGTAAAKHFAADSCCKPGASCCFPGSPCCNGAHGKGDVAQR